MTVASVPIREIDGVPASKTLLVEPNCSLLVCSHEDQTLLTLRFLSRTVTLEASRLQSAIQGVMDDRSKAKGIGC
jgi:hypothetical protein